MPSLRLAIESSGASPSVGICGQPASCTLSVHLRQSGEAEESNRGSFWDDERAPFVATNPDGTLPFRFYKDTPSTGGPVKESDSRPAPGRNRPQRRPIQ